jgi:hypothetical protein
MNLTKSLIEAKLYMNLTKSLIEPKLYMNPTKNLIEPKLLGFIKFLVGFVLYIKFRFYQVLSGDHVKFRFYQFFGGIRVVCKV